MGAWQGGRGRGRKGGDEDQWGRGREGWMKSSGGVARREGGGGVAGRDGMIYG